MEYYWDAYLTEVRRGKTPESKDGETVGGRQQIEDMTPRELLRNFYEWLQEKGQIVH